MKIAVMGSGGVGGYFGARLAAHGYDVTFIARGAHLEAIHSHGLAVQSTNGDVHVHPATATDTPSTTGVVDHVLFATKLWDTETAGEAIRPLIGPETAVISLQNGVDAEDRLAATLGREHVMGGLAQISAIITAPGVIRHTGTMAKIVFGELDGDRTPRTEALLAALRESGVDAEISDNIERSIWQKFVFLVALSGVTSVTRHALGPVRQDPDTRALLETVMMETVAVARAKGIDIDPGLVEDRLSFFDTLPAEMTSSMHQDLERGNRLELNWLSGTVTRMGREYGVETPANAFIYAALKLSAAGRESDR
ncbi:MAG: 2-dehydropantoate 2-reductase [Gammaproteobacteria bacterium]|nr:MAG: 2-dehydropantoate 2-reductase [Gammaproteobacteria bacterium]